jgi:hypothetical protein
MQALAGILIALAAALLRVYLQQRQTGIDAEEKAQLKQTITNLEGVTRALRFKAVAAGHPRDAAELRVRDGAKELDLSGPDARPDDRAQGP